jgi:uncharacterized membrane protein HdeD (DUF308 family)
MATSDIKLWKIVRMSGMTAIFIGLWYFVLPPAISSALVESLQHASPDQQFELAREGLSGLLWTIGAIQIFHGVVAIICSRKALKRDVLPPQTSTSPS